MAHTPWNVRSISGYAGGTKRKAGVTLFVETESDTVEDVRKMVEAAPDLLAALEYWFDSKADAKTLAMMARAAINKAKGA